MHESSIHGAGTTLILSADDFGLHPDIDEGIIALAEDGIVRRVSVMPTSPNFSAERLARLLKTPVAISAHISLIEMPALLPERFPRWWVPDGIRFLAHWRDWIVRAPFNTFPHQAVADEVRAQLKLAIDVVATASTSRTSAPTSSGLASSSASVSAIDSHQNLHLFPPFAKAFRSVIEEYPELKIRSFVDLPMLASPLRSGILLLSQRLYPRTRVMPTIGIHQSGKMTEENLGGLFDIPKRERELALMVHPGKTAALSPATFTPNYELKWREEFDFLGSARFREIMKIHGLVI